MVRWLLYLATTHEEIWLLNLARLRISLLLEEKLGHRMPLGINLLISFNLHRHSCLDILCLKLGVNSFLVGLIDVPWKIACLHLYNLFMRLSACPCCRASNRRSDDTSSNVLVHRHLFIFDHLVVQVINDLTGRIDRGQLDFDPVLIQFHIAVLNCLLRNDVSNSVNQLLCQVPLHLRRTDDHGI